MGIIFKCDRCGSAYDDEISSAILIGTIDHLSNTRFRNSEYICLCKKCTKELDKYIHKEEITTKPSMEEMLNVIASVKLGSTEYRILKEYLPYIYKTSEERKKKKYD